MIRLNTSGPRFGQTRGAGWLQLWLAILALAMGICLQSWHVGELYDRLRALTPAAPMAPMPNPAGPRPPVQQPTIEDFDWERPSGPLA